MSFFETVEARFPDWNYGHPRILYALIRSLKPVVLVEVGTYRGYAACYMARALQENNSGHLYCIDNFSLDDHVWRYGDPEKHWNENLAACGVRNWVTLLRGDSNKVQWPDKVDFAYIDGWHSYRAVQLDFSICQEKGAQCICLDDTINCVGPRLFVSGLLQYPQGWDVIDIAADNGLSICMRKQKHIDVTFSQELPNHPGVDLTKLTPEERNQHFRVAALVSDLCYDEPGIGIIASPRSNR